MDLRELHEFGEVADRLGRHAIEHGGYIVPGPAYLPAQTPWKETQKNVAAEPGLKEARSSARSRQGSPSEATSGRPIHPVERLLNEVLKLEELYEYHPSTRVLGISSNCLYMVVPVGLFRSLPHRAHLLVEIPIFHPDRLVWPRDRLGDPVVPVPDVRAWAFWDAGILITSHHTNPDLSICACMPGDWQWGVHPLYKYVELCMVWIGKTLHTQLVGRWPGIQHYSPTLCLQRNPTEEYCHCGTNRLWRDCHMDADRAGSAYERVVAEKRTHLIYLSRVRRQGRPAGPPISWGAGSLTLR